VMKISPPTGGKVLPCGLTIPILKYRAIRRL